MRTVTLAGGALLAATLMACGDENPMSSASESGSTMPAGKLTLSNSVAATAERPNGIYGSGPRTFTVTIENRAPSYVFHGAGVFNTPAGEAGPGPALPGGAYEFSFVAGDGAMLSFATMYVQSNDLFFAPGEAGVALFEGGAPISGDITAQIGLWDAGTEVNQEPGTGADQAPRQSGADTGASEGGPVQPVSDGFSYPAVDGVIAVTVSSQADAGATRFTVRIANLETSSTPLAPGVWVVHAAAAPLFTSGSKDRGAGLEGLAEDGNPGPLSEALQAEVGVPVILAPGAWAVHRHGNALYQNGAPDRGEGLENLAEDGDPSGLAASAASRPNVSSAGAFTTPSGAAEPGVLLPGHMYEFEVTARPGDRLSLATMFVQSNDLFYGTSSHGLPLYRGWVPRHGDVTGEIYLWDAGTETNQAPGWGADQAPRQSGPDTGAAEQGAVMLVEDGFSYPSVAAAIVVSISNR